MESNYLLNIYPSAQKDLASIFEYINNDLANPSAAFKLINTFRERFEDLRFFPE